MAPNAEKKLPPQPTKPTPKKALKKPAKKPVKAKEPPITEAQFKSWLFSLKQQQFIDLQTEWNERNLRIDLKGQKDYDAWLNYFKTLSPNVIRALASTGLDILSTEAYAALSWWHDIIKNPHRIGKIHQAGLANSDKSKKGYKSIVELAQTNDRLAVLMAVRDQIAAKLDKGAGARDTASLTREMTDVMSQIAAYEKKQPASKKTMLGQLTEGMPQLKKRERGKGSRGTSFSSRVPRVTIDDVEEGENA